MKSKYIMILHLYVDTYVLYMIYYKAKYQLVIYNGNK